MNSFPHKALTPGDVEPPITLEQTAKLMPLLERLRKDDPEKFHTPAAVCIAVFQGGLVRWLVNGKEVGGTICNAQKRIDRDVDNGGS